MTLRLHRVLERSAANGPGERFVVWVQGCRLACPGCFNAETWDFAGGFPVSTEALAGRINATPGLRGVTLSGGEPLEQPEAVADLLARVSPALDRVLYTGYSWSELERDPRLAAALEGVDLAVAGRFVRSRAKGAGRWAGSTNKEARALTGRIGLDEFPEFRVEARIAEDGTLLVTGFPAGDLLGALGRWK